MVSRKRNYDSTVARIAGNIASGIVSNGRHIEPDDPIAVARSVALARAIVEETRRTEPPEPDLGLCVCGCAVGRHDWSQWPEGDNRPCRDCPCKDYLSVAGAARARWTSVAVNTSPKAEK